MQPYSDCACTQTSLHICDLRMPYDWFYHDTIQNGRNRDKCDSIDLDELAHYEPPHQELCCFKIHLFVSLVLKKLIVNV